MLKESQMCAEMKVSMSFVTITLVIVLLYPWMCVRDTCVLALVVWRLDVLSFNRR